MRLRRITIIVLVLSGLLFACNLSNGTLELVEGSGNVVTEDRQLSGFTSVSLDGVGRLEIDQTGSDSVSITADDNLLPYIKTTVRGQELIISIEEDTTFTAVNELVYHVTVKSIDTLEVNGAGEIEVTNLDGDSWQVNLDGGASITVSGDVTRQEVVINGLGIYNGENLTSKEAVVEQNGAGSAVVNVSDTLDVTIDGVGSVEYIGDPTVTQELNGLGSVSKR